MRLIGGRHVVRWGLEADRVSLRLLVDQLRGIGSSDRLDDVLLLDKGKPGEQQVLQVAAVFHGIQASLEIMTDGVTWLLNPADASGPVQDDKHLNFKTHSSRGASRKAGSGVWLLAT